MKAKEIRDLIDFIAQSGLAEVNIESEDFKISVKRNNVTVTEVTPVVAATPAPVAVPAAAPTPVSQATPAEAETPAASTGTDESNLVAIKSPMIGTFYRSSNPDAPAFANIGDTIEAGQTVCIIEAMKLFNEIESDISGTIVKILVDNSTPVEYDQPLFLVQPK